MHNTLFLVQILEGLGDLKDDVPRQVLTKVREPHDLMEKFTAWGKFEDDVVVLFRFGEVDELDDVGMIKLTHDLNLLQDIRALQTRSI